MKAIVTTLGLFFLLGNTGNAQIQMEHRGFGYEIVSTSHDTINSGDTVAFSVPKNPLQPSNNKNNVKTRFFTFEMGMDVWIPAENYRIEGNIDPFEQRLANSTNVNIYIMRQRFNLIRHKLNLEYGVGLNFHKIMFDNPIVMRRDQGELSFNYEPEAEIRKSRLSSTYLTIPLMLNFESNPDQSKKSFRIAGGVYGNTRLGSNFKQKFNNKRSDNIKESDNFNLSPFRWGLAGQIGYGPINFYVNYSMTEVFDTSKTDYDIGMVSAGLIIIPF